MQIYIFFSNPQKITKVFNPKASHLRVYVSGDGGFGSHFSEISGDGGFGSHFSEIAKRFGRLDWAIMENGQYNADWRYIHSFGHKNKSGCWH